MARALLSLAVVAVCIGLATAQLQICDPKKAPGEPWNTLLTKNTWDASANAASECFNTYSLNLVSKAARSPFVVLGRGGVPSYPALR